jgi:hypothetical protein
MKGVENRIAMLVFTISTRDVGREDTGDLFFWLRRTTTDERATADDQAVRNGGEKTNGR